MLSENRDNSVVGYLHTSYLLGGKTSKRIKVIGREEAVTHFGQERKGVWYFVGSVVAMFLSVLTQNYEMTFVSFH